MTDNLAENALSEREAASSMRLSPNTLRKWRGQKIGPPFVKISSRCVRYYRSDLDAWMKSRRIKPNGDAQAERARP